LKEPSYVIHVEFCTKRLDCALNRSTTLYRAEIVHHSPKPVTRLLCANSLFRLLAQWACGPRRSNPQLSASGWHWKRAAVAQQPFLTAPRPL